MRKQIKKLALGKETLRYLQLTMAQGGTFGTGTCPATNETVSCGIIGSCGRFCPNEVASANAC